MTKREHKYHDIKSITLKFKRIGCGFRSHVYVKKLEALEPVVNNSYACMLMPTGAYKNADGTYPILDPEFLKQKQWETV